MPCRTPKKDKNQSGNALPHSKKRKDKNQSGNALPHSKKRKDKNQVSRSGGRHFLEAPFIVALTSTLPDSYC